MTRILRAVLATALAAALAASFAVSPAQAANCPSPSPAPSNASRVTVVIPEISPTPTPTCTTATGGGSGSTGGSGNGGNGGNGGTVDPPASGGTNPDGSPIPAAEPGENKPGLTLDHETIEANQFMIATGTGYVAGEKVQMVLYPGAVVIGSVSADAGGEFTMRFRIPDDTRPGVHIAEATGWSSGFVRNKEFTVTSSVFSGGISPFWWLILVLGVLAISVVAMLLYFRSSPARPLDSPLPQGSTS